VSADTPTKLVARRIHAVLTRAKAAHTAAHAIAAAAYAGHAEPPAPKAPTSVGTPEAGGGA
jgi:hypothetical protein